MRSSGANPFLLRGLLFLLFFLFSIQITGAEDDIVKIKKGHGDIEPNPKINDRTIVLRSKKKPFFLFFCPLFDRK
jgi:hypothetical protein